MKRSLAAAVLLLPGCASLLGLEDGQLAEQDAGVEPPDLFDASIAVVELFVDPGGNDNSDGSVLSPFRTISHAVSVAEPGWIIHVAPGTYNAADEVFPIDVSALDLQIIGAPGVLLLGDGSVVFDLGASSLVDFQIDTGAADGVHVGAGGEIRGCAIDAMDKGIVATSRDVTIVDTSVTDSVTGLVLQDDGGGGGTIERVQLFANSIGLDATLSAPLAIVDSDLTCNIDADVRAADDALDVVDSRWDHVPPTSGNFGGGIDTTTVNGATITADNAQLAVSPCP